MEASDAERDEAARVREKQQRRWATQAHPFDRSVPMDLTQQLFDDDRDESSVVVAFTGAADKLGVAAVDFFDVISDLPVRRVYIRQLVLTGGMSHVLGSTVEAVLESLEQLLARHTRRVFAGSSVGAYHALLLGTLLRVDTVLAINPVTSFLPEARAAAGDGRYEEGAGLIPESFLMRYGDIAQLWGSEPAPRVVMPYARYDATYSSYARRIEDHPSVESRPVEEYSVAHKITADGSLRTWLASAIGCEPGNRVPGDLTAAADAYGGEFLRHPLSGVQRGPWKRMYQFAAVIPVDAPLHLEPSAVADDDHPIAERLMNVFHAMQAYRGDQPADPHPGADREPLVDGAPLAELENLLTGGNVGELAAYLRNGLRQGAATGLGTEAAAFARLERAGESRRTEVVLLRDQMVSLAAAAGGLSHEYLEQGESGESLRLSFEQLLRLAETGLGVEVARPPVMGMFGIAAEGRVVDPCAPGDAYAARRLVAVMRFLNRSQPCAIGGGLGGVALQVIRSGARSFTVFDSPMMTVLQGWFLMKVLGGDAIRMFSEDVPPRRVALLPTWEFFNEAVAYDLVFNESSLPDMPPDVAGAHIAEIDRRTCALLSIDHENRGAAGRLRVRDLVRDWSALESVSRHRDWIRPGYVEELFVPAKAT